MKVNEKGTEDHILSDSIDKDCAEEANLDREKKEIGACPGLAVASGGIRDDS